MINFLQHMVDAISLGSLYALAALGIGLIFGVMRLVNFAHGDFITVGAYTLIVPSASATAVMFIGDWPWPGVIFGVVLLVILLALFCELLVFRPLRTAAPATMMIGAFALSYIIQHLILAVYDSRPKMLSLWPTLSLYVEIHGLRIPRQQLLVTITTVVLLISLISFLKWTKYGLQMRAAAEDFNMARLVGVRANTVISLAFALSACLAAAVSLLFVTRTGMIGWKMGLPLMVFAFIATVIGGMGSLLGATLGGFIVGLGSALLQAFLPIALKPNRDAFVFALVVLILLARPGGIVKLRAVQERI